jgi:CheY-like chemotaxis protein
LRSAVEPFFTTKAPGRGSGLGLSQVYGMIRQSNGALQIESEVGAGTTVRLYLPRAGAEAAASGADRPAAEQPGPIGRILVVDDDAAVREVTVQMLRQCGYGIVALDNGRAALDALARGEVYDLMMIDVAMPGMNGIETARQAREQWPELRVLYVTGYADLAASDHQTGDDPIIKKPFRFSELAEAVRLAIKREPAMSGENVVPPNRQS